MRKSAQELLGKMRKLKDQVERDADKLYGDWRKGIQRTEFDPSAANLAAYMALRRHDLRELQWQLIPAGLSSLGRLEARVIPTIDSVIRSCESMVGEPEVVRASEEEFLRGEQILDQNTERIFGPEPANRYTRIMVTLPTEAAREPDIINALVARGMEVARINCSHDDETVWTEMLNNVRYASQQYGRDCRISMEIPGPKIRIDRVLSKLPKARVFTGDVLFLTGNKNMQLPAGISIAMRLSIPEIIDSLKAGEPVIIDDGHVEAVVEALVDGGVLVRVTKVIRERGVLIRPEKGINFPGIDYRIPLLSERDKEILQFACKHADMIGCSFVRDKADIDMLLEEMAKHVDDPSAMPVILKLETLEAVRNLPELLVAAASHVPTAVMIARGDLAVEVGYARLSEYQEEILWICESAHIPVIWATQVVENLVKTGIPTRAEISDVTLSAKSECLMLNKGPHINEAVEFVGDILSKFEHHVYKKTAILRQLTIASDLFEHITS